MKKTLLCLTVYMTLTSAYAADLSIAIIDSTKIFNESLAGKSIQDQLEKKQNQYRGEIKKREESLNKMGQDIVKQQSVLSETALEEKKKDFNDKMSDAQRDVQDKGYRLNLAQTDAIEQIQKEVTQIVEQLSVEKNYTIVLDKGETLYAKAELDITGVVLDRLNQKLTTVTVKFDEGNNAGKKAKK